MGYLPVPNESINKVMDWCDERNIGYDFLHDEGGFLYLDFQYPESQELVKAAFPAIYDIGYHIVEAKKMLQRFEYKRPNNPDFIEKVKDLQKVINDFLQFGHFG